MLTADLVQARSYRGEVRPRYIDPADAGHLALARQLIEVFTAHLGRTRGELERALSDLLGAGTAFLLHRGLGKLLADRAVFETEAPGEPSLLRRATFEAAARAWRAPETPGGGPQAGGDRSLFAFSRRAVLEAVATARGPEGERLDPERLDQALFADLKDEQVLREWKPCSPGWLLNRYNVALAQAVLLRATELTVRLGPQRPEAQRALFRKVKFFQLLHRVERAREGGWVVRLDGPLSLFRASQRYGLQMASFLPTLLHFDDWSLTALLAWGKRRGERTFKLSPAAGLKPFGSLSGQWRPEELATFPAQFDKLGSQWEIECEADLVELGGQGVLVPDFAFRHRPSGRRAFLDVLGFWNRGAVAGRLALLRRRGPENLLLAVSRDLATGAEGLDELPGEVYVFRSMPLAREVLARLERLRQEA